MANSESGESVIDRIVMILSAFNKDSPRLTMSELSRSTGLPGSTAHRLASDLLSAGLLERDKDGRFGVGAKMWELAARSNPVEEFRRRGLPVLEGVHAAVRQHVSLSVPRFENFTVLYVERLDQHGSAVILSETAGRLDAHNTSPGLVMVAHSPLETQNRLLSAGLERTTAATETDPARIRTHLALIRERGFARLAGVLVPDNVSYAVPVFGPANAVIGAVSVVVPQSEDASELIVPVLIAAGRTLSRTMGAERRPYGSRPWLPTLRV